MQNILQLFVRYGTTLLFVVLELVCLFLIVNYNQTQKSIFLNTSKVYANTFSEQVLTYRNFVNLKEVNDSLSWDYAVSRQLSFNQKQEIPVDSFVYEKYSVTPSLVVKNSSSLRNNTLTINKGIIDNVSKGMGVISRSGLVGVVTNVSDHYAKVNSILHSQTRISCTVEPYLYPGNLVWDGKNPNYVTLEAIPEHLEIHEGDVVSTNGFSTIFPKNIKVGIIDSFKKKKGQGTYIIKVKLNNYIAGEQVVYVLDNNDKEEIEKLMSDHE